MNSKHRKDIVSEAMSRIKNDVKDYDKLLPGKKESIQDNYISIVCIEKGYTLSDFYNTDGIILY